MPYDNSAVRRQDRLLDEARARELLAGGRFGVLSLVDGDGAYGIPVNYVWDGDDSLCVHCAPDGRKLRCIDRRDRVSFCVVGATEVCPAQFTTAYESIVLDCRARRGLPPGERMRALELLLEKYSPAHKTTGLRYAEASFARTEIVRLDVVAWSGKTKRVH
ncbi:pyridoxamine 5'-phosphate oxidase family protein [Alistipes communis]|uniref:pyridoxamine 5'-phosphate oxidase family protein n=1 Tax=Alistipes communis TaxID=2585118 RepID=UPI00031F4E25|nr:pyridoxamine 5'-phosphate oxidase family protein [Alistipes communis]